jgi:hypothetical protein
LLPTFSEYIIPKIGDGSYICFWEDKWRGTFSFANLFSGLCSLSNCHDILISLCINQRLSPSANRSLWNFQFQRDLQDNEVEDFENLHAILEGVRLDEGTQDSRCWTLESSISFSCKSFFGEFTNDSFLPLFLPNTFNWKAPVPYKVKVFACIAVLNKLNTGDMLQKRRPHSCLSPSWCYIFKKNSE